MAFDFKMNFFFVYDTTSCKTDDDDPKNAVVIFFPVQPSESQGHFLCCQLAGVAKFLKTTFSAPAVIGLDQGKFAFLWSGKYLVGLGADTEVHTSVLRDQLVFLCGIFCFYHGNMSNVLRECKNNRSDFLLKLELCWSRYITLSQCFGSVLQLSLKVLSLKTGRKGSSVVSTANRLLHLCQMSSFVTAGAVFYNSRVLSTQFSPQLTNYLSLLSNCNASAPVDDAHLIPKNLPPDVGLKSIYLSPKCVSSIHRLNHSCMGSHIRRKTRTHSKSLGSFGSGSEADVDSGNCSESVRSQHRTNSAQKPSGHELDFCWSRSGVLEKSVVASRNWCLSSLAGVDLCRKHGHKDSGANESVSFRRESVFRAGSFLCNSHAHLRSKSFLTESSLQHTNLASSVDTEFRCSLCRTYNGPARINELSLKKWNSDFQISKSMLYDCSHLALRHCRTSSAKSSTDSVKFQILKCQSNSDSQFHVTKRSHSSKRHSIGRQPKGMRPSERSRSLSFCDSDKCLNIEENDLQKHVLYVQRYGGSTLVLLLDKTYDKKVINYLWNCGFTSLRELESSTERQEVESPYNIEPSFYILLYNHVQRILKEYPHFPSLLLTEKHSRQTIQKIQEDFKLDSHFHMMCLLSSNYSIFACHKDQNLGFYLQPETNSRKLDPLLHLGGKAVRRLGKYFKVAL